MSVTDLNLLQLALLLVAGTVGGFINTLAGGGSLLTIPALLFAGIPSQMANATNRVAVVMQSVAGAAKFRQKRVFRIADSLPMLLPSFAGSVLGSFIAVEIDEQVFDYVLGVVLILMLGTLFMRPTAIADRPAPSRWIGIPVFFLIGVYGGFVQAGVGFLLIAMITLLYGYDLVKTNALKLLVVALYSLFAIAVFAWYGQVLWIHGMILGLGNIVGALIGVRLAVLRGTGAIKWVIVVAVVLTALKLFGVFG
ncbi:MAG: sulfite exporter TauE/SafE family protein [Alkalispirochaeta sp.]